MGLTSRSSRDRFAARLARYRVPPRQAAARPGLTQVLERSMEESQEYRFKISLRFRHPENELSHCSTEFGLEPSRQWTFGKERTSPRGNPLEGLWDASYWTTPLDIRPDEDLETALVRIGQWLKDHASFLASHRNSGGSAALFIGFFLEGFNTGFLLAPSLLEQYASLGVALEFDLYGPEVPPAAL